MQRRDWLKTALLGLCGTSFGLQGNRLFASQARRRLVLIELAGANDGLNTLVPIKNDHYHKLRPSLSLTPAEVTDLQDDHAMHESLNPLMDCWENGEMAWVHGLGYPEPNRSHFKSIALWESGGDGLQEGRRGWLTHDVEHSLGRQVVDAHGISLVNDMNLFNSESGRWLSMSSPDQLLVDREPINTKASEVNASIGLVTARMQELDASLVNLQKRLSAAPKVPRVGVGRLGNQLQQVLQLIQAGLDTPVYRVQLPGFDTHEGQLGRHRNLLRQLGRSLAEFRAELIKAGEWDNTLVMSYSEFGRRATENRSNGTDHGTAAPHIVMGGQVQGGLFGTPTDLSNLVDGDPAYTLDYRSLYDSVLSGWFDMKGNQFSDFRHAAVESLIKRS